MEQYLKDFLRNSVGRMEGATNAPYDPVYAGGNSGLSYGRMQNDVAANKDARAAFRGMLDNSKDATGLSDFDIVRTMWGAMTPGATRERLNQDVPGGAAKVAQALDLNHGAVDARDSARLDEIAGIVDNTRNTIARTRNDPVLISDPYLLTDLGAWANRSGNLNQTTDFLGRAPDVTRSTYDQDYLKNTDQFAKNGEDFGKWSGRVDDATKNAMAETFPFLQPEPGNLLNSDEYGKNLLNSAAERLRAAGY